MREPAPFAWHVVVVIDRFLQDLVELAIQLGALFVAEGFHSPARMDPGLPQDLVDDQVSRSRQEPLVHEDRFGLATTSRQPFEKCALADGERVWPEPSEDRVDLLSIVRKPRASELAHVPVPELVASVEDEDHSIVTMALWFVLGPDEVAGHAEVKEQRRSLGPTDQPFAEALRVPERVVSERVVERIRRCIADDRGVGDDNFTDRAPRRVAREEPAIPLDVGKLRHDSSLSLPDAGLTSQHG
jgi:hypothetical protein